LLVSLHIATQQPFTLNFFSDNFEYSDEIIATSTPTTTRGFELKYAQVKC